MAESWQAALPAAERRVYEAGGFGQRTDPGRSLAVIVVDATYGFVGHRDLTDTENGARYPNWCGRSAWDSVPVLRTLVEAADQGGLPLVLTVGVPPDDPRNPWRRKHARLTDRRDDDLAVIADLTVSGARVMSKFAPSAFFASGLAEWLRERDVTDVLVGGCTTSGCVRATVVDAFSHGFSTFVVSDAVFDRAATSHAVSLFEMNQKYATVIPSGPALESIASGFAPSGPLRR